MVGIHNRILEKVQKHRQFKMAYTAEKEQVTEMEDLFRKTAATLLDAIRQHTLAQTSQSKEGDARALSKLPSWPRSMIYE